MHDKWSSPGALELDLRFRGGSNEQDSEIGLQKKGCAVRAVDDGSSYWRFEIGITGIQIKVYDERANSLKGVHKRSQEDYPLIVQHWLYALDVAEDIEHAFRRAGVNLNGMAPELIKSAIYSIDLVLTDQSEDIVVRPYKRRQRERKISQKVLDGAVDMQAAR